MITITTDTTARDLVHQIREAGGLAAVTHNGSTVLIAAPDQDNPWEPALRIVAPEVTR